MTVMSLGLDSYNRGSVASQEPSMQKLVDSIATAVAGSGRSGTTEVKLILDGDTLAKKMVTPISKANQRYGMRLVEEVQG
jgi:hypothetical protein